MTSVVPDIEDVDYTERYWSDARVSRFNEEEDGAAMRSIDRPILADDDPGWAKVPYQVYFGDSFQTGRCSTLLYSV